MIADANAAEASAARDTSWHAAIRSVTDDEVASFEDQGWVLLRGLVSPELCQAMLERGKPRLESAMATTRDDEKSEGISKSLKLATAQGQGTVTKIGQWIEWRGAVRDAHDPVFSTVALDTVMSRNMRRLLGRDKPLRIMHDIFTCKLPDGGSTSTAWHQDSTHFPLDRNALTVWIALEEIKPGQGPLQFYTGSHRRGMLGTIHPLIPGDLRDQYPELERLEVSPAHHLQPGDATVHHGLTVHGAGANNCPDPRWSYLVAYFPSDARYTGAPSHETDGFDLKPGFPIEHPSFTPVPE